MHRALLCGPDRFPCTGCAASAAPVDSVGLGCFEPAKAVRNCFKWPNTAVRWRHSTEPTVSELSRKKPISKPAPSEGKANGKAEQGGRGRVTRLAVRFILYAIALPLVLILLVTGLFAAANPPITPIMAADYWRLGYLKRQWVAIESVPRHLPLALIAAEDANFCTHWGYDVDAIRAAGPGGGASLSQQTARDLYLWRGSGGIGRILETIATGAIELIWTKRRIAEVYMNIAEFDAGVFGVDAAARHFFCQGRRGDD